MSDESTSVEEGQPDTAASAEETTPSEWQTVIDRVDELGDAVGRWAKAAVNDPDNRKRVEELREHLDRIGVQIGDSIKGATESDTGQQMKDAAGKAGDAIKDMGQKFSDDVLPKMASAFDAAADKLVEAADRMETKAAESGDDAEPAAGPGEDTVVEGSE